ncbi:hypothetical protein AgCh_031868 [Apium graveolens]
MSRRPDQHRVSASGPGSSEPLTPGLRPSQLVSEPQWPIVISSSPSRGNPSDSDDSDSERTLDVVAEKTPMPPPPVPPVAPGGVSGPSIRPRWVRRSVSAVRDFPPRCGHSASTSRPPVPPSVLSGASSPIPYHVHRAVNQSLIREQSPGLAAQLDQIPVGPFQGIPAPSPNVQERVRSLTQVTVERARTIDHFISSEFRAVQYQDLVNWLVFELGSIEGEGPVSWARFTELFLEKYFPDCLQSQLEVEFLEFKQGEKSVAEYEAKFTELARLAPGYVNTEIQKGRRFQQGLKPEVRSRVVALQLKTYTSVVQAALVIESDQKLASKERSD